MEKNIDHKTECVRLMAATDLHHLSKRLYDKTSVSFQKMMQTNDGKLSEYSEEILEQLKQEVIRRHPDALLLTGDLTFNGEMISLKEVKDVCRKIKDAGIEVIAIPGNHDIRHRFCFSYFNENSTRAQDISEEEFRTEMADFGFSMAISRDETSSSYVYELNNRFRLLTLDANTVKDAGSLSKETLKWAEGQLIEAKEKGYTMISLSHQNVLIQSRFLYHGYVMNNHEEAEALLKKYGVFLNISGHSHLQHISRSGTLTDVCCESLSLYPLQYGWFEVYPDSFHYEGIPLGILKEESWLRFRETVERMTEKDLSGCENEEIRRKMSDYAVRMNAAYFTGDSSAARRLSDEEGLMYWQKYAPGTFWETYLSAVAHEKND